MFIAKDIGTGTFVAKHDMVEYLEYASETKKM